MSTRWDDTVPAYQRERWLLEALALLSLDVTGAVAADLGIGASAFEAMQSALRRGLAPALQARLNDPLAPLEANRLLGLIEPEVQTRIRSYYDEVVRYQQSKALFCWGIVLNRCARDDALWRSLWMFPEMFETLRNSFWASEETLDIQERLDAAFEVPLSAWDVQVATLGLFPPEEGVFGIGDQWLLRPARVVRQQAFWRNAARGLGPEGLREVHTRAQAFLTTQKDLAPAFGLLHDPWLLAHPELTQPDLSSTASS